MSTHLEALAFWGHFLSLGHLLLNTSPWKNVTFAFGEMRCGACTCEFTTLSSCNIKAATISNGNIVTLFLNYRGASGFLLHLNGVHQCLGCRAQGD